MKQCFVLGLSCAACSMERKVQPVVSVVSHSQITDLTSELADERFKGDVTCQALESEWAERLQALREVRELKVRAHGDLLGLAGRDGSRLQVPLWDLSAQVRYEG